MPLYEYQCENGHRVEVIQKFSDPPLQVCATCGAAVQKLQASPAFQFKGSGWYITDYAKKDSGGKDAASKDKSTAPPTDGGAATKSESKGESKSESSTESKNSSKPDSAVVAPKS